MRISTRCVGEFMNVILYHDDITINLGFLNEKEVKLLLIELEDAVGELKYYLDEN